MREKEYVMGDINVKGRDQMESYTKHIISNTLVSSKREREKVTKRREK